MAGSQRCFACGNDVPFAAAYCPRCGRTTAAPLRDLERIDLGVEPVGAKQQTVARSGGGSRRRGVATLLAIGAVLAATVVLLSGGGGGHDDTAAVPETTTTRTRSPNTRLIYPEPTQPGETTSTRPTTSRPPTTTSTTTTLVTFLGDAPGPVLGDETGGLSVYSFEKTAIRRLELDTGRVTTLRLPSDTEDFYMMTMRGDRVVLSNGPIEKTIARDLSGGLSEASFFGPGNMIPGTDIRWSQESEDGQNVVVLQHPGQDDVRLGIPPGLNLQGFLNDRMVLAGGGRIFTLDLSGRLRDYAAGSLVSAYGQWVLWWSCDAEASCGFRLGTATDANARSVQAGGGYNGYDSMGFGTPLVAPDGEHAVLPGLTRGAALVELATGKVLIDQVDMWGHFTWSPDGRWLFQLDEGGVVEAVSTADGHVVDLLPVLSGTTSGARVLAVG